MENVLNDIITDVDLAAKYLDANVTAAGTDAGALTNEIKEKHKQRNAQLCKAIAEQLKARKEIRNAEAAKLDGELAENLKSIEEKYSQYTVEQRAEKQCQKEYKDEVSGVKTVHLRSMRKLNNDYEQDVVLIKSQQALLYQARNKAIAKAKGKDSDGQSIGTVFYNFKASFNPKKTVTNKNLWKSLTPLLVLIALFLA